MLKELQLNPETFAYEWFFTLYSRAFDLPIVRILWDIFLTLGDYYVLYTGVVLLSMLESTLKDKEDKTSYVRLAVRDISINNVVKNLLHGDQVSQKDFDKMIRKCIKKESIKGSISKNNGDEGQTIVDGSD